MGTLGDVSKRTDGGLEPPLKRRAGILEVDEAASAYRAQSGGANELRGIRGGMFETTSAHQANTIFSYFDRLVV